MLLAGLVTTVQAADDQPPEARMFAMLNEARVSRGLNPLALNPDLARAAQLHAEDMAKRGYMEHENPEGEDPRDRAEKAGYMVPKRSAWLVLEGISARPTAEIAMDWLLTNAQHSRLLLHPRWREGAVAYVQGGPYGQFWVLEFGCRPNVLPIFASVSTNGSGVELTLTDEACTPTGAGENMGKPVEMAVFSTTDFSNPKWEPFTTSYKLTSPQSRVYVKLRDAQGRSTVSNVTLSGVSAGVDLTSSLFFTTATQSDQRSRTVALDF
jgi:hypothetical protein